MKRILYVMIQCTWGIMQTIVGLIFFVFNMKCEHHIYRGCIDTKWNSYGGISLGLFIFTPKDNVFSAEEIRVHEYGHTIQSLLLGPLYLIIVGIISFTWANLPYFRKLRNEKQIPYTACFVEAWASKWGELVTKEKAIWK